MNRAHYSRASPYSLYVTSIESPSSGTFSYRLHNRDRNVDKFELLSKLNKEGGGTESVAHESTYEPVDIQMGEHVYLAESGLMTSYNLSNGSYFHVEQFLYASTDEESAVYNLTAALDVHHNSKTRYQYHNRSVVFACITMVKYGSREDSPTAVGYSVVRVNEMNAWDEEDDSSESQGDNRYGTYKLAEDAMISSTVPFLSIISHDIDKDGNLDVIVGTQGGFFDCEDDCDRAGGIYALYGTADPLLTDVVDIRNFSDGTVSGSNSFGYNHVLDLHVDDIDEDGDVDMVVSMKPNSTTYEIHLYLCNGNRSFSSTTVLRTGLANVSESQPRQVRILDMNNDGLKDVVFASTAAEFVVVDFIYRWQYKTHQTPLTGMVFADTSKRMRDLAYDSHVDIRIYIADDSLVGSEQLLFASHSDQMSSFKSEFCLIRDHVQMDLIPFLDLLVLSIFAAVRVLGPSGVAQL
ncbi:hypothetical protein CYMTET_7463 [Cymbomonas tetramitiformis]|uniref:Uncharacterized protein n=1 Tax=Cymbomonas tetramitiformis TaxID=36881 RepID=A0AAE0LH02_9CHLO|nr:hypothetical protein CYMTET_7463 [Cymbomonas tetramitiformis]